MAIQYRARIGEQNYREGIVNFMASEYDTKISVDSVLATQGVSGGIVSTLALVRERGGTHVGIIEPFYTYHIFQTERLFGKSTPITYIPLGDAESNFAPDWQSIEEAVSGKHGAKLDLLILCNPSNPTGRVWTKDELDRIIQLTKDNDCILLLDECYSDMVWKPAVHYSPIQDQLHDHVVVARGFSKVLGCQSWRVGYTISSPDTIAELMRVQDPIYICVPWLQHAFGAYLTNDLEDFRSHREQIADLIQGNWALLSKALQDAFGWEPLPTSGSMYGMLKHGQKTDMDAVKRALGKNVGVCPGSMFFSDFPAHTGYVRIHCGVSKEKAQEIVSSLSQ